MFNRSGKDRIEYDGLDRDGNPWPFGINIEGIIAREFCFHGGLHPMVTHHEAGRSLRFNSQNYQLTDEILDTLNATLVDAAKAFKKLA